MRQLSSLLAFLVRAVVRDHHFLHQRMPHHIPVAEVEEFDPLDVRKDLTRRPASTAGRQRTIRLIVFSESAAAAAATARKVFPVPAGPIEIVMSKSCMACR